MGFTMEIKQVLYQDHANCQSLIEQSKRLDQASKVLHQVIPKELSIFCYISKWEKTHLEAALCNVPETFYLRLGEKDLLARLQEQKIFSSLQTFRWKTIPDHRMAVEPVKKSPVIVRSIPDGLPDLLKKTLCKIDSPKLKEALTKMQGRFEKKISK